MVALGILLSRIVGLVRMRIFGHFLGTGPAADAFTAALRIPNILQNLLGEGALSASFIPVYAGLLNQGDAATARRVARAVAALIGLAVAVLVLLGVLAAPLLTDSLAGGFPADTRALTIRLVRILFPATGLLAISAWCLGILNSHRRFFLSYAAPVAWNLAMIAALLVWGSRRTADDLVVVVAWASVAGSALQVLVQLPTVLRLLSGSIEAALEVARHVRTVIRNFLPALLTRGVVQISAYVDTLIASLLPGGAMAALSYAQTLYNLPVSLFGISVSAAELPEMAGQGNGGEERNRYLRERLARGLRQIAFFVIPTIVGFVALGGVIVSAIYETGRFSRRDSDYVWAILACASVGLLATTLARLYSSTFYALQDTRTPMRFATFRVFANVVLGILLALRAPAWVGLDARWGAAGLTLASSACSWMELALLRAALVRRIGVPARDRRFLFKLLLCATVAALAGISLVQLLGRTVPVLIAGLAVSVFALIYFYAARFLGVREADALMERLTTRLTGSSNG